MPNFRLLDRQFRLTPWTQQDHADYVAGQYGSLLATDPKKGAQYLAAYRKKEQEAKQSFKDQQAQLTASSKMTGSEPQKLTEQKMLDWDPTKRFTAPGGTGDEEDAEDDTGPTDPKKSRFKELTAMLVADVDKVLAALGLQVDGNKPNKIQAILAKEFAPATDTTPPAAPKA